MGAAVCSHAHPFRMATFSAMEQESLPLDCCFGAVTGPGSWGRILAFRERLPSLSPGQRWACLLSFLPASSAVPCPALGAWELQEDAC